MFQMSIRTKPFKSCLDFQLSLNEKAQRDDAQNSRSRTRNDDGNHGNACGVRYNNITFGSNCSVTFIGNQQDSTNLFVAKKE